MKLVIILLITFVRNNLADQWVDPHDMNTNAKEKYVKHTLKRSSSTSSINEGNIDPLPDICYTHLRRMIGVFMNSAHVDKKDPDLYYGNIRFNMNPENFDFLLNFGKEDLSLDRLRKLDRVLSESFRRTYIDEYLDTIQSFQLKLYSIVVNIENIWLLGAVGLLYFIYQCFKNNFSFAYIFKYLILVILVTDYGFRYYQLLEEAEEHNMSVVYSEKCDTNKMSWGSWMKYMFTSLNCERKSVTPLDVFLYQIKHLIIIPMHAFGTGMGGFGKNMFTSLPWGLNIILWPIMLIFTLILLLFFLTICTGQSMEFNIFHLIKMKFGGNNHRGNALLGTRLEELMDRVPHRPMVQNVHISVAPSEDATVRENDSAALGQICDSKKSSSHSNLVVLDDTSNSKCKALNDTDIFTVKESTGTCNKSTNTCYIRNTETDLD